MSRAESDAILAKLLDYLQSNKKIRMGILVVLVGALVAYGVRSVISCETAICLSMSKSGSMKPFWREYSTSGSPGKSRNVLART